MHRHISSSRSVRILTILTVLFAGCISKPPSSVDTGMVDSAMEDAEPMTPDLGPDTGDVDNRDVVPADTEMDSDTGMNIGPTVLHCGVEMPLPIARWDMTPQSGMVKNSGRGSSEMTLDLDGAAVVTDRHDEALDIPGTLAATPHVDHHAELSLDQGTVSVWVYPRGTLDEIANAGIVSKDALGQETNGHLGIEVRDSVLVGRLQRDTGAQTLAQHNGEFAPDEWHHVAVTWKEGEFALYVDGAISTMNEMGWSIDGNEEPIGIGFSTANSAEGTHDTDAFGPWDGLIDDVAFWDSVLAPNVIATLYGEQCVSPPWQ